MSRSLGTSRTLLLAVMTLAGYYVYQRFYGIGNSDSQVRAVMAAQVARDAIQSLPIPEGRPTIAVAPTLGDFDGVLSASLRKSLERRNAYVVDMLPWDSLVPGQLKWTLESNTESAIANAARRNIPYIATSRVVEWSLEPADAKKLVIEAALIRVEDGKVLHQGSFSTDRIEPASPASLPSDRNVSSASVTTQGLSFAAKNSTLLFSLWLACGIALPWVGSKFISNAIRSHANAQGVAVLLSYVGFVLAGAWLLWGQFEPAAFGWKIISLLVAVAVGYLELVAWLLKDSSAS